MSGNTSATGGFLLGTPLFPQTEDQLTNLLQGMTVGITGLDPTLVRPRWQPQPPTQPSADTDWCAIGILTYINYDFPEWTQDTNLSGTLHRLEELEVVASFYGPNSSINASVLRDGMYVQQNYQTMAAQGIKLCHIGDITHVPELINRQYISRSDVQLNFMRMVERGYPVETLVAAEVTFVTDNGLSCIETIKEN